MKRLLFITGGIHYPPRSGYGFRVYNLIKSYAKLFEVVLIADSFNAPDENELKRQLDSLTLEYVFVPKSKLRLPDFIKECLHPIKPRQVTLMTTRELKSTINDILHQYPPFDFIHVQRLRMAESIRHLLRKKTGNASFILDLDDWESKTRFREVETKNKGGAIKQLRRLIEPTRLRAYENRILPLFDYVYVCSEVDRAGLSRELKLNNFYTVPNGVDIPATTERNLFINQNSENKIILYIGSLGYGPNIDAIEYFVEHIFPLILQKRPEAKFWIAGNMDGAPRHLFDLNKHPSIRVLGFVENLRDLYEKASVFIVPLRQGGGTRIKILEASTYYKPIVSTSVGAEGLEFQHGRNIMIADDPEGFSDACCELLNDIEKGRLLGEAAREIVEQKYLWLQLENRFRRILFSA